MKLDKYLGKLTPKEKRELANKLKCSLAYLLQIATNVYKDDDDPTKRFAGTKLCVALEKETLRRDAGDNHYSGVVFKWDLRPDYFDKPRKD